MPHSQVFWRKCTLAKQTKREKRFRNTKHCKKTCFLCFAEKRVTETLSYCYGQYGQYIKEKQIVLFYTKTSKFEEILLQKTKIVSNTEQLLCSGLMKTMITALGLCFLSKLHHLTVEVDSDLH